MKRNKPASYEERFSYTRIASIDVCEMGNRKHHLAALIELDKIYRTDMAWYFSTLTKRIETSELE